MFILLDASVPRGMGEQSLLAASKRAAMSDSSLVEQEGAMRAHQNKPF